MIPLHLHTDDLVEPPDALYHLVAANGVFLVSRTPLFTAITRTDEVPGLRPQKPSLQLQVPRVPRPVMERIWGFFRAVYHRWAGEAVVFLYYQPGTREFQVMVPAQTLFRYQTAGRWRTHGRVEYGYCPRAEKAVKLGDCHSHADLPAFHSSADDHDEAEPGLHITLGRLDRRRPDVSVSFVVHGTRFLLAPEQALEDFSVPLTPPRRWLDQVTCRKDGEARPRALDSSGLIGI